MDSTAFFFLLILLSFALFLAAELVLYVLRDDLFMILYGALFVYTIFTQIGYAFYPELAQSINVYCGPEAFFGYWAFINLSMVAILGLAVARIKLATGRPPARLGGFDFGMRQVLLPLFYAGAICYLAILAFVVYQNFDAIGYARIEKPLLVFMIFRQPVFLIIFYAKWRRHSIGRVDRFVSMILFFALLAIFITVAARAGQRLVVWCLFIGIGTYEMLPLHKGLWEKAKKAAVFVLLAFALLHFSNKVVEARRQQVINIDEFVKSLFRPTEEIEGVVTPLATERLIGGDYFVPSSILFVMMEYKITDFFEVVRSNFYNSLVFMNYPQMAEQISSRLMDRATRNEGYAYYILNEGYQALGWGGIIYNAVLINLGYWLWRGLFTRSNPGQNELMIAVMATSFLSMVRAPSFYFIKDIYLTLAPAYVFGLLMIYRPVARPLQPPTPPVPQIAHA